MILVAKGAPAGGHASYAPGGGVPDFYAQRVFDAFDKVRPRFGLVMRETDGAARELRLFSRLPES
ncbi:MAG: hypothetical protein M5R36_00090 [Deltaproteobacteria bacterium]|nr:hypothetical protein [Deltaproteobacteria bacterium]